MLTTQFVRRARSIAFAAVLAGLAIPSTSHAMSTQGISFGLSFHSNYIGRQERSTDEPSGSVFIDERGGGLSLYGGYGFTPSFALRLSLDGSVHETTDAAIEVEHSSVVIEGMYLFRDGQLVRPYLCAGIGGFRVHSRQGSYDFATTGPGAGFGGGLEIFVAQNVALELGARVDAINWEEQRAVRTESDGSETVVKTPVEKEGGAAKFRLGVSFWI